MSAKDYLVPVGHQISKEGRSLAAAKLCSIDLYCKQANKLCPVCE